MYKHIKGTFTGSSPDKRGHPASHGSMDIILSHPISSELLPGLQSVNGKLSIHYKGSFKPAWPCPNPIPPIDIILRRKQSSKIESANHGTQFEVVTPKSKMTNVAGKMIQQMGLNVVIDNLQFEKPLVGSYSIKGHPGVIFNLGSVPSDNGTFDAIFESS